MPKIVFVPPGGFVGFAQQTPAVQALLRKKRATKKRSKKARAQGVGAKKARRSMPKKKASGKRLVKGSPEARRRMAKIRKMRK